MYFKKCGIEFSTISRKNKLTGFWCNLNVFNLVEIYTLFNIENQLEYILTKNGIIKTRFRKCFYIKRLK